MKVVYFFDILEGNFFKYYLKLKKLEIRENIVSLRKIYKGIDISIFCLNKGKYFLSSNNFSEKINSVLNEYLHIDKNTYNDLVNSVWSNVKKSFENLTKNRLNVLNNFWSILEYRITTEFMYVFEKFEFIKSIIKRENPDIIYISQKDKYFYEFLKKELNIPDIKFLFLKSQFDYLYHKINRFSLFIYNFLNDYKNALFFKFRVKKRRRPKTDNKSYIGLSAPGHYYYSKELLSVINQLKRNHIKYKLFRGIYDIPSTFLNIKFKYALVGYLKLNIKHIFENTRNKNEIIGYILPSLKDYAFDLLKDIFFDEIIRIIYIIKNFRKEIESSNYKVIIILNEFGPEGKIAYYVSKNYGIPIYFIPYCGIPRRESDVTPYLSDIICVDGELDKKYLTKKGVNPEKILVRGSPKYEPVMKKTIHPLNQIKDHFTGKSHTISREKHKILLATNFFANESNWIILTSVVNVLKKLNNVQFIIKLHPSQDGVFIRNALRKLKCNAIIVKDVNILEMIKTADVFLTEESSVILDSMVVGTPIICLDLINRRVYFSGKHVYNDEKYIIIVQDEKQLYQRLKELLTSQKKLEDYKNSLKANLKLILYHENNYSPSQQIILDLKKLF